MKDKCMKEKSKRKEERRVDKEKKVTIALYRISGFKKKNVPEQCGVRIHYTVDCVRKITPPPSQPHPQLPPPPVGVLCKNASSWLGFCQ